MTVYYMDPEDGDNAQAGTSFATRKKTPSGFAALTAADELRIIASRDPIAVGNCVFTNGANAITGTFPVKTIDNCDTAWTGMTNATVTASTLTSDRIEGAAVAKIVLAAGFTTGKAAYRTLPAELDLSAFDSVSFMMLFASAAGITGGYLALCSDTTGDVVVETIRFNYTPGPTANSAPSAASSYISLCWPKGAPLPSSVKSVAVYFSSAPGPSTLYLDNIIATTKGGLNHNSLIGKMSVDEPYFWPINYIQETAVGVGQVGATISSQLAGPYNGVSETVPAFIQPVAQTAVVAADRTLAGTAVFKVTGGWNRTDMSTRTGKTYLSGGNWQGVAIGRTTYSLSELSYIGFCAYVTSVYGSTVSVINDVDLISCTGTNMITWPTQALAGFTGAWNLGWLINGAQWTLPGDTFYGAPQISLKGIISHRSQTTTAAALSFNWPKAGKRFVPVPSVKIGKISYCQQYGLIAIGDMVLNGTTFVGNTNDIRYDVGDVQLVNCTFPATEKMGINGTVSGSVSSDKKIWMMNIYAELQNVVERTAGEGALKLSVLNATNPSIGYPALIKVAEIAVDGTQSINVKGWLRRTSLTLTAGLRIYGGMVKGVDSTVSAAGAAAINTWEQLSLTVTPTGPGVIEVWAYAYGVIADCFIADLTWP